MWIPIIATGQNSCTQFFFFFFFFRHMTLPLMQYHFLVFFCDCYAAIIIHPVVLLFIFVLIEQNMLYKIALVHFKLRGWSSWKDSWMIKIQGYFCPSNWYIYFLKWGKGRGRHCSWPGIEYAKGISQIYFSVEVNCFYLYHFSGFSFKKYSHWMR